MNKEEVSRPELTRTKLLFFQMVQMAVKYAQTGTIFCKQLFIYSTFFLDKQIWLFYHNEQMSKLWLSF